MLAFCLSALKDAQPDRWIEVATNGLIDTLIGRFLKLLQACPGASGDVWAAWARSHHPIDLRLSAGCKLQTDIGVRRPRGCVAPIDLVDLAPWTGAVGDRGLGLG